jgi:hydrogenase maturation protease
MKTLVVGLGNPILTDDGIGVKVAYAVEEALASEGDNDITVTEAGVGGLRLMEMMIGYDRVILVDALTGQNGNEPGTIHRMTLEDLRRVSPTQHSASAHDTSLVTALEAGRYLDLHLPEDIVIYAIEVENISDFCAEPTPAVAAAIPGVTMAVLQELHAS